MSKVLLILEQVTGWLVNAFFKVHTAKNLVQDYEAWVSSHAAHYTDKLCSHNLPFSLIFLFCLAWLPHGTHLVMFMGGKPLGQGGPCAEGWWYLRR